MTDIRTEQVNLVKDGLPADYHCDCSFCSQGLLGVLKRADGSYYKRTDRREYYAKEERKHFAKTPLHAVRWAIQQFVPDDGWVLDPTMGAGTTAVEALNHGANVVGVEIQFIDVIRANVAANNPKGRKFKIIHGDARDMAKHLEPVVAAGIQFDLINNNPPYFGDKQPQYGYSADIKPEYDTAFRNLGFDKENKQYWDDMLRIYETCVANLKPGGHFTIAVKDQMRNKKPDLLHKRFAELLLQIPGLAFKGVALLPHFPRTLFMNTYGQFYGRDIKIPLYQTILVFQKDGAPA